MEIKSDYETFTLQEIFAQPDTIANSLQAALESREAIEKLSTDIQHVTLIGCGTAYHACVIGKSLIEEFAGIRTDANIASEFHIGSPVIDAKTLVVLVSQSGETADSLVCLEMARNKGATIVVLCNVPTSTMVRLADVFIPIACGREIGVASTKAYTAMLLQLVFLAIAIGIRNGESTRDVWAEHESAARELPMLIGKALTTRDQVERLARTIRERRNFAFMGRDVFYPTACEGALKLRELSYRNAEGFGGGELKHGTLALVEPGYPIIAVAPRGRSFGKMIGNIQEIRSRGAKVIGVISEGDIEAESVCDEAIRVPSTLDAFMPLLTVIPLQLFAYEFAKTLGRNIDRPRNLAKSVTVE